MAACLALAFALTASLAAPPAFAGESPPRDPTARSEWLSTRAEAAFSEGRFADAIKLYLDAWEAVPSAAVLYNVAFIYDRRLDDPDLAIQYYERAASSPDADRDLIDKARNRVAAIRAAGPSKKPPPKDPSPPEPLPDEPGPSRPLPLGPIITMGAGGVVFIGGLALGLVASSTESDFKAATTAGDKRELQSRGKTEALAADLLMVAGGLAVAGGLVWYLLDAGRPDERRVDPVGSLRVEPVFVPGGAALVIGGPL